MADFTQIKPQTATATSAPFYTDQYDTITVSADSLGGAATYSTGERVTIFMVAGVTNITVMLPDGVTPAMLTEAIPSLTLNGGPRYVFVKSATATLCGVYVDPKEHT